MAGREPTTEQRIIERFLQRRQFAYQYRERFEPTWRENFKGYMNKKERPHIPNEFWTKRTRTADEFKYIETLMPQHVLNTYRSRDWFGVGAPTGSGEFYEELVRNLLLTGWNRAGVTAKSIPGFKYGLICGHMAYKVYWDVRVAPREVVVAGQDFAGNELPQQMERRVEDVVVFNGVSVDMVDLFDLYLDPTGLEEFAIHRMPRPLELLRRRNDEFDGDLYDGEVLDKLRDHSARHRPTEAHRFQGLGVSPYDVQDLVSYVEGIPEQRTDDTVDIWEYWDWIPPDVEPYNDTQWRKILIAEDKYILSNRRAPTPDLRHPFVHTSAIPIPGRLYGASPLTFVEGLADLKNFLQDARREEVIQKLWQPMVVDENSNLSPEQLFRRPGGVLWTQNPTGRLSDSILFPQQRDVMNSSYNEPAVIADQIEDAIGATDPFRGDTGKSHTTATAFSIAAQLGSARYQVATIWLDETFKKAVLEKMFKLYQTRLTQKEIVEVWGGKERYNVDLRALLWDIDIVVDSGLFGSMDNQLLNSYLQLYSVFANNPRAEQWLKHERIIKDAFTRAGDWRASSHVKSPQEVNDEMEEAATAQAQAEERGAQQQAQLDTNRELARGLSSAIGRGGQERGLGSGLR